MSFTQSAPPQSTPLVRRMPVVLYGAGKVNWPRPGKTTAALARTPSLVAVSRRPPGVGDSARAAGRRTCAGRVRTAAAPICRPAQRRRVANDARGIIGGLLGRTDGKPPAE